MSLPNKDEMKGKFKQAKGEVKEKYGQATKDPELIRESQDDKTEGEVQEKLGTARRKVGDAISERVELALRNFVLNLQTKFSTV